MAETYSDQYSALHLNAQRRGPGLGMRGQPGFPTITYTQAATGTIGDTIVLHRLEGPETRVMPVYWAVQVANWQTSTTLSIGWKAYTDRKGNAVAESATGILNALAIATDGITLLGTNAALQLMDRQFSFRGAVDIFATINGAAPAATATLKVIMPFVAGSGT